MTLEQIQKQNEQMEGFKAGYQACLQWIAATLEAEKRMKEAEEAKSADAAKA